jgi:hypothetical protein
MMLILTTQPQGQIPVVNSLSVEQNPVSLSLGDRVKAVWNKVVEVLKDLFIAATRVVEDLVPHARGSEHYKHVDCKWRGKCCGHVAEQKNHGY